MSGAGTGHRRRDCPNLSPFHRSPRHRHGKPDAARLSGRMSGEIAADRAARSETRRTVATVADCPAHLSPSGGETVREPVRRDRGRRGTGTPQAARQADARANPSGTSGRKGGRLRRVSGETWRAWGERLRPLAGGCPSVSSMAGRSGTDRGRPSGGRSRQTVRRHRARADGEPLRQIGHRLPDAGTVAADRERPRTVADYARALSGRLSGGLCVCMRMLCVCKPERGERLRLSPIRHRRRGE